MSLTDRLRSLFGRFAKGTARRGYMYVPDAEANTMTAAGPGREIRVARKGPWLVVDHDLSSIVVAQWPGRLWHVEASDPISNAELRMLGAELRDDAGYTRACGVTIIDEVPVAKLFGAQGASVIKVIDAAGTITADAAARLAGARHADAPDAQNRLWKKWLTGLATPNIAQHRNDFDGTLSLGPLRSPIGSGLSVVHAELGKRAQAVAGKSVWISEPRSDDVWLAEPWASASSALLDAALAYGVPELADDDREILSKAWREVIGTFE